MNWGSLLEGLSILVAALVSITGAIISIKNRKQESKAVEARTNLDEAQQAEIVRKLADSTEEMYLKRIESFKDDIRLLRSELSSEREESAEAREKASLLEDFFFNYHVPWDKKIVQEARDRGWDVDDPPSWLTFLHSKGK